MKTKDKILHEIALTTPYHIKEVRRVFDLLKSYDLVICAADLGMWTGTDIMEVAERMYTAINDL